MSEESTMSPWVVASTRTSNGPYASINALLCTVGHKRMYGPYERPPFPIKIDKPTCGDLASSLKWQDFYMAYTIWGGGVFAGYGLSRGFPYISQRLLIYHGISHISLVIAMATLVSVPYRRLTGFADNGLRWSKPEDRLRKYDMTSHFENATGWRRWRIDNTK